MWMYGVQSINVQISYLFSLLQNESSKCWKTDDHTSCLFTGSTCMKKWCPFFQLHWILLNSIRRKNGQTTLWICLNPYWMLPCYLVTLVWLFFSPLSENLTVAKIHGPCFPVNTDAKDSLSFFTVFPFSLFHDHWKAQLLLHLVSCSRCLNKCLFFVLMLAAIQSNSLFSYLFKFRWVTVSLRQEILSPMIPLKPATSNFFGQILWSLLT